LHDELVLSHFLTLTTKVSVQVTGTFSEDFTAKWFGCIQSQLISAS
jgi:hypothetical protein